MTEQQIENGAKALYELGNTGDPFIDTLWDDAPPDNREEAHDLFLAALAYIREQAVESLFTLEDVCSEDELDAFLSPPVSHD